MCKHSKIEQAICLKQSLPTRPGEKKIQWNSSFINSSSTSVNTQKTEQAICLKQSIFACTSKEKEKFPSLNLEFQTLEFFFEDLKF